MRPSASPFVRLAGTGPLAAARAWDGASAREPDPSGAGAADRAPMGSANRGENHADLPPDVLATGRTPRVGAATGLDRTVPPTDSRPHHPSRTSALGRGRPAGSGRS